MPGISKIKQLLPFLTGAGGLLLGAFMAGFFEPLGSRMGNGMFPQREYAMDIAYCSDKMPMPYYVDSQGVLFPLDDPGLTGPHLRSHMVIENVGTKQIDNVQIFLEFKPEPLRDLLDINGAAVPLEHKLLIVLVLFSGEFDRHDLEFNSSHMSAEITLREFNPNDTISLLIHSFVPLYSAASAKIPDASIREIFSPGCEDRQTDKIEGVFTYLWQNPSCLEPGNPSEMDPSCGLVREFDIPEAAAPGLGQVRWSFD